MEALEREGLGMERWEMERWKREGVKRLFFVCRACLHFFFIDHQSVRELRITRIPKDAVF